MLRHQLHTACCEYVPCSGRVGYVAYAGMTSSHVPCSTVEAQGMMLLMSTRDEVRMGQFDKDECSGTISIRRVASTCRALGALGT